MCEGCRPVICAKAASSSGLSERRCSARVVSDVCLMSGWSVQSRWCVLFGVVLGVSLVGSVVLGVCACVFARVPVMLDGCFIVCYVRVDCWVGGSVCCWQLVMAGGVTTLLDIPVTLLHV
eukprot:6989466-Pyramimonas_sp.AAC.1